MTNTYAYGQDRGMAKKSLMLIIGILIVILLAAGYYLYIISSAKTTQTPPPKSSTASKVFQKRDINAELNQAIKANFGGTKYFQDIDAFMGLAKNSKTTNEAYQNYLRAFKKASEAYKETKSPNYRSVLVQMKDFLKVFPSFKEAEVVIPK